MVTRHDLRNICSELKVWFEHYIKDNNRDKNISRSFNGVPVSHSPPPLPDLSLLLLSVQGTEDGSHRRGGTAEQGQQKGK